MGFGIVENANRDGTDLFISIHEFSMRCFLIVYRQPHVAFV